LSDRPGAFKAEHHVLSVGYTGRGVAATCSFVRDGEQLIIFDPGMVANQSLIFEPLAALSVRPDQITDVILSHHHPDNIMNVGVFANANVHDHGVIYKGDGWVNRDAEGYELSPSVLLIRTPGHSDEDISALVGTSHGIVALAGDLWWSAVGPADDPVAPNRERLKASRERIIACADLIVPGHGEPFVADDATPR
jgi:glyoxylase-like metal-dependent hydrolase (beta-lactamase superfamily II)